MQRTMRWFSLGFPTLCLLLCPSLSSAQTFSSGSTGADGPFNPTSNTAPPMAVGSGTISSR